MQYILSLLMLLILSHEANSQPNLVHCFTPQFQVGTIYYKEGAVIKAPVNYNLLTNRMYVLNDGKKKNIDKEDQVEYIGIGLNKFVYIDGDYGEIIFDGNKVMLTVRHGYKIQKADSVPSVNKNKLSQFIEQNNTLPPGISLKPDSLFYLVRQPEEHKGFHLAVNKFEEVSLRAYTKIFSNNKADIETYIRLNHINLKNSDDLIRLTKHCDQF